ncbi:MAG: hypothetical protein VKK04_13155 [Synechococcales bacterium]|nr:hypothetical protein [Synechococcales bacterium]
MLVVMLIALLFGGILLTELLAYGPLFFLSMLHLPRWFILGGVALLLAWLLGDR